MLKVQILALILLMIEKLKLHRKSGIEKGLEDIRKGNVFRAKNSQDLAKQILVDTGTHSDLFG